MKRKKIFVAFAVVGSVLLFAFTGCSKNEKPIEPTSSSEPTKTETTKEESTLVNPMEEKQTTGEIVKSLGYTFEDLPEGITDVKFFTIDNKMAQADFKKNGVDYTARKAKKTTDDITGVYTTFAVEEIMTDDDGDSVLYKYNENAEGVAIWSDEGYSYSLYCPIGFNLTAMEALVDEIE